MRSGGVVAAAAGAVDAAGAAVGGAAWAAGALLAGADDAPPVQASSARESTTSATGATRPARGPRGNSAIFRLRGPTSSALLKPGRSCTGYGRPWASIGNAGGRRYPLRGGRRTPDEENEKPEVSTRYLGLLSGSGGRIRTGDLRVMSPTSYHCSTPRRRGRHRPIVPAASRQYRRRWSVSRPCSGRERVGPPRARHRPRDRVRAGVQRLEARAIRRVARPSEGASTAPSALSTASLRPLPAVHGR